MATAGRYSRWLERGLRSWVRIVQLRVMKSSHVLEDAGRWVGACEIIEEKHDVESASIAV